MERYAVCFVSNWVHAFMTMCEKLCMWISLSNHKFPKNWHKHLRVEWKIAPGAFSRPWGCNMALWCTEREALSDGLAVPPTHSSRLLVLLWHATPGGAQGGGLPLKKCLWELQEVVNPPLSPTGRELLLDMHLGLHCTWRTFSLVLIWERGGPVGH